MIDFYSWLSGLIDGEGYFLITKTKSKRSVSGYLYFPLFGISLRSDDLKILYKINNQTGLGKIYKKPRYGNDSKNANQAHSWIVSGVKQCMKLIDILEDYPLQSKKHRDYVIWKTFTIAKAEHGRKTPESLCEYYFLSIKEIRKFNQVLVNGYELGLQSKESPVLQGVI